MVASVFWIIRNFIGMIFNLLFLGLFGSVVFVVAYGLGANKVNVPYVSEMVKTPERYLQSFLASLPFDASAAKLADCTNFVRGSTNISDDLLKDKFKLLSFAPFSDPNFKFSAIFPKGWQPVSPEANLEKDEVASNLLGQKGTVIPLVDVASPESKDVFYQAKAVPFPQELSLDKFYEKYAETLKGNIVVDKPEVAGRKHVLIKYTARSGNHVLVRSVAARAGGYVLYLNCCAKEQDFPSLAEIFNLSALSFTPFRADNIESFDAALVLDDTESGKTGKIR